MKKYFLLLLVAGMTISATAQETTTEIPTKKHRVVTNGFWDNWFIDFGYDYLSAYSNQEHGMGVSGNPFSNKRGAHGFDVSIGKWATPSFGMRAKFQAAWAKQVNLNNADFNPLYNQVSLALQPMINLHNLFAGYKPRVWNIIAYGSFGWLHNCDNSSESFLLGAGILNQFNVTKRFHINVDIYANAGDPDMDGRLVSWASNGSTPLFQSRDWLIGWSVGCGFNLGKVGWDNAPDVDAILAMNKAQVDALNASLADSQAENDRLQNLLKNQKPVTNVIAAPATTRASVFFNINKSKIASRKDLVNVKEIAEYAIANNRTVVVTGYADSNTGSAEYNQTLSQRRAEAVAAELVKMGVSSDKIETAAKGGVNDLDPFSYNRRATVTLK